MDCRGTRASLGRSYLVTRRLIRAPAGLGQRRGACAIHTRSRNSPSRTYCQAVRATNLIKPHRSRPQCAGRCGGVPVFPGDIMVATSEGVVAIRRISPRGRALTLRNRTCSKLRHRKGARGQSIFGLYPPMPLEAGLRGLARQAQVTNSIDDPSDAVRN